MKILRIQAQDIGMDFWTFLGTPDLWNLKRYDII